MGDMIVSQLSDRRASLSLDSFLTERVPIEAYCRVLKQNSLRYQHLRPVLRKIFGALVRPARLRASAVNRSGLR